MVLCLLLLLLPLLAAVILLGFQNGSRQKGRTYVSSVTESLSDKSSSQ
jgi:hypothetical protein